MEQECATAPKPGRTRDVTLVLVDRAGNPRGSLGPLIAAEPWWPEVDPVLDALGHAIGEDATGAAVLRLLRVEPGDPAAAPDPEAHADGAEHPMGGRVTYAVEHDGPVAPGLLRPVDERDLRLLAPDPLRAPWARPGGPAADLDWVDQVVEVTGRPRQHRTWNLSSIWSIPTTTGAVWLKTVPPFLGHEAAVLDVLANQPVPRLVAADGHRLLLAALPGEDGYTVGVAEQIAMVTTLVDLQVVAAERVEELVDRGVPDLRAGRLTDELDRLVDRLAPERVELRRLVAEMPERLAQATRVGPPDTLVHGDPHPGNCRRATDPPIWFDWGDAFVGNPLLDLAATHRMAPAAIEAWLAAIAGAWPGCEPGRAAEILAPVAALRQAWVYQRFLDGIEPSERIYHRDDVGRALDAAEALFERA